jgi:hypothetical protein
MFGGGIAEDAAWDAVKFVSRRLERYVLGEPEERTLLRLRQEALHDVIDCAGSDAALSEHTGSVVERLFGEQAVAALLLNALLTHDTTPLQQLSATAVTLGFEPDQIYLPGIGDFAAVVEHYRSALGSRISNEARKSSSPIFNLVTLAKIDSLLERARFHAGGHPEAVRRFMAHYVGDGDREVPFCGRDSELAQLSAWLNDQHGKGALLVTAPAGRGKSALLVRWLLAEVDRTDIEGPHILFVPISQRFQTHTSEIAPMLLAAQVGSLYGQDPPRPASAADLIDFSCRLLRQPPTDSRRVVVVFDGLDEASGWSVGSALMPLPAAHLKVVAATRLLPGDRNEDSWLRRLDWAGRAITISLEGLSVSDLAQLIDRLPGVNDLSRKVLLANLLFEKTKGDPLLVELWVTKLLTVGPITDQTLALLRTAEPDLGGIFAVWLELQRTAWGGDHVLREQAARSMLRCFAVAYGPLTSEDLQHIDPEQFPDSLAVSDTASALGRFVAGDAITIGLTFCHPRLTSYFREEALSPSEVSKYLDRITAYCVRAFDAWQQSSAPLSKYVVRHIAAHLEFASQHRKRFYALASERWLAAWTQILGETAGFIDDVTRVARAAGRDGAIAEQVRANLVLASMRSQGENLSAALVLLAVEEGVVNPATAIARSEFLKEPRAVVRGLTSLGDFVPAGQRHALYQRAFSVAVASEDLGTLQAFIRAAPAHYRSLAVDYMLSVIEAYRGWWAINWLAHAASVPDLDARDFKAIKVRLRTMLNKLPDDELSELTGVLPEIVALDLPERARHFRRALKWCPWHFADRPHDYGTWGDEWAEGPPDRPREHAREARPSGHGAALVRELYSVCRPQEKAKVRRLYLEVLDKIAPGDFAGAVGNVGALNISKRKIVELVAEAEPNPSALFPNDDQDRLRGDAERIADLMPAYLTEVRATKIAEFWKIYDAGKEESRRPFYAALKVLPYSSDDPNCVRRLISQAKADHSAKDRATMLTYVAPFVPKAERRELTAAAWANAFLVDDEWVSGPTRLGLKVLTVSDPDAATSIIADAPVKTCGEASRELDLIFFRSAAIAFRSRTERERFGELLRRKKLISLEIWLKLFGQSSDTPSKEILAWTGEEEHAHRRLERLLDFADVRCPDSAIVREIESLLDKARGLNRIRAIARLGPEYQSAAELPNLLALAREGALGGYDEETKVERLVQIANALSFGPERTALLDEAAEIAEGIEFLHPRAAAKSHLVGAVDSARASAYLNDVLRRAEHDRRYAAKPLGRAMSAASLDELPRVARALVSADHKGAEALSAFAAHCAELQLCDSPLLPDVTAILIDQIGQSPRRESLDWLLALGPLVVWTHGRDEVARLAEAVAACRREWP